MANLKKNRIDNLFKKIKFYQDENASNKYSIPNELEGLVAIKEHDELLNKITLQVNNQLAKDEKDMLKSMEKLEGRSLPWFLTKEDFGKRLTANQ